ncbi:MAG: hypothetical protein EXR72_24360, partial [Myxococcales bacterium]|nr:hypothetical protein [Myxococcales bacterium]
MDDLGAHLVDRVLPRVPVGQWVITFPTRVRWHLAHDPKLAGKAITARMRVIFAWQRRRARERGVDFGAPKRSQSARNGAIVFVQGFNSERRLSLHLHALVADGVFAREGDRARFPRIPPPTDEEIAALLDQIARRIVKLLGARLDQPDEEADDHAIWIHAAAARRVPGPAVAATPPPPLCARKDGFSLHAAVAVHENDREGL